MIATPRHELVRRAFRGYVIFQVALALMIFLPAWTVRFWQGWLYWVVFSLASLAVMSYFLKHDPALVERRLAVGPAAESEKSQKQIQAVASAALVALFVLSGFDHQFGWSPAISAAVILAANGISILGWVGMFLAFRENSHAAAVVTVADGQPVISTGPYGQVRHPMYTGAVLLFFATPVALASLWGLVPAAVLVATIVIRLLDEERYLAANLPGYRGYQERVRSRLIPGVW